MTVERTLILDADLDAWLEAEARQGGFADVSSFLTDLAEKRRAHKEAALEELRDLLDKAEASGVSERSFEEIWDSAAARDRSETDG